MKRSSPAINLLLPFAALAAVTPWLQATDLLQPGYTLHYPDTWKRVPGTEKSCVGLARPHKPKFEEYSLEACYLAMPLERAAADSGTFEKKGRAWVATAGPGTPQTAKSITGQGWNGITATIACGIRDENGPHTGECLWTIISNGRSSLVFDTVGFIEDDAVIDGIIRSARFAH